MFSVSYELDSYILFRRNSVFKESKIILRTLAFDCLRQFRSLMG
jgi:hypothetical protein